jgi:hypothetical protein
VKASERQLRRWDDVGRSLAYRHPAILVAITKLVEAMLVTIEMREAVATHKPITAERMLRAARSHGIAPWGSGLSMALLASIPGLDLDDAGVRAWLFEMHRREEIKLIRVTPIDTAERSLKLRGERPDLVAESEISDGSSTYHAMLV